MNVKRTDEIVIVTYRPEWPVEFEQLAAQLADALGPLALRIDHIGSTSVPGLAAKDIIDVQVTVAELNPDALDAAFARMGCTRAIEVDHDHVPPTVTDNGVNWRKLFYRPPATMRRTNLHVRRAGSANGRYALLFRDYLREHPVAAGAYAQVKMALSRQAPNDWEFYYHVKDPVCDIVMAGAEEWVATTGWQIEHYI